MPGRIVRFGVFEVDFKAGEVRKHGRRLRLQEKPFHLLQALLERPGDVISREELRARLWPADTFVDFDNNLRNAVNKVRAALVDSASLPRYVETVGRRGYRFIAAVDAGPPEGGPHHQGGEPPEGGPHQERNAPPQDGLHDERHLRAPAVSSIAVLPLANLSDDIEQEYFSDGMTDALISRIAGIRSLRVISRQSIVRYKGSHAPMPEIARELGVDALVEGTVLRAHGRVRITLQLVHGPSDEHLWSGEWERGLDDVLTVQSEIARAVASAVEATVTTDEASRLARTGNLDPAAYDAYLRGRFFWNRRTKDGLLRSIEYYRRALAIEPDFAVAHAAIAESYGPLGYVGFLPPHEATPAMRAAATRALEIDPDLVEGLTAIAACASFHEWRWKDAERDFRRAIAVQPNYTTTYLWYGLMLEIEGRHEESVAARRRALELDPLNLRASAAMGSALFAAGRVSEAIALLRSTLELDPQYFFARRDLALINLLLGNHAEAIAGFEAVRDRGSLGHALGVAGRSTDARRVLEALEEDAGREYVSPVQLALVHVGLGERAHAMRRLEQAFSIHAVDLAAIRVDVRFAPMASDPRFTALLERMNLEPCVTSSGSEVRN